MDAIKKSVNEALECIEQTTTLFYQQKNKEGYLSLNLTLNTLINTINLILSPELENNEIYIDEQKLNTILANAMKAIELNDTILLSDILIFELKIVLLKCI